MSADVKLYTSEDLRSRAVTDVVLPSRLRATVEALERVTKERDAALAACAEMRGELQAWACEAPPCAFRCPASALCERTQHALSSDAGRGWVSPEEHAKVIAVVQEASMRIHAALIWGFDPNAAVGGLVRAVDALIEDRNARVSPEAFDAALLEVADAVALAGSPKNGSRCADGGRCDHYECREDRMFAVTNRRLAIAAIIAAAKAKHGGGR